MKIQRIVMLMLGCLSLHAMAQAHQVKPHQVYIGVETHNEHRTGNKCVITVHDVLPFSDKGLHCYSIKFQFNSVREELPKNILQVDSRVTNYHRPEFPQTRTCAMNVNGATSGNEIYGDETSVLYNQIFGGSHSEGGIRYDYFLTLEPDTKNIVRARVHVMKTFDEYDVDCINLELM